MIKQIDLMFRTMVAELQQRAFDDDWAEDFPPSGRFVPVAVDGRRYWYFDQPDGEGRQRRRYVGPADDPLIAERVETFKGEKSDYKARRKFVSTLTREAGLIAADRFTGDVIQALAKAGIFRLRGNPRRHCRLSMLLGISWHPSAIGSDPDRRCGPSPGFCDLRRSGGFTAADS